MRLTSFIFVCILCIKLFLFGEELQQDTAIFPAGQVFQGNYYALGDLIEVSGIIKGNAYLSGTQVLVDGDIEGDLFVLAGNLEIKGKIHGDVWILAGGAAIAGNILKDAILLSANAEFKETGKIGGNLTLFAGNAELENSIGGNVTALTSHLKVAGMIGRNLRGFVGKLRVFSTAHIQGDLKYKSNEIAFIDPRAQIGGAILYHRSFFHDLLDIPLIRGLIIGSKVAAFLMNFIYTFVMGAIIIRLFPKKLEKALVALQDDPWKSLLYGLVLLVLFPLASLVLLATVIGAPFALTLIALNIVTFYTAKIFTILWVANGLFSKWKWKRNGMMTLASGQILYCLLVAIPFVGTFFAFLTMVFGLGAIAVAQKN